MAPGRSHVQVQRTLEGYFCHLYRVTEQIESTHYSKDYLMEYKLVTDCVLSFCTAQTELRSSRVKFPEVSLELVKRRRFDVKQRHFNNSEFFVWMFKTTLFCLSKRHRFNLAPNFSFPSLSIF